MNHRARFRDHAVPPRSDIRGSLERHVGTSADAHAVETLARRANSETELIVFTPAMLSQLDSWVRTVIEGAARKCSNDRRRA